MNKGNVHTRVSGWWYDKHPGQREKEERYYQELEAPVKYRKKSPKKNPGRSDHKHLYENVEIIITHQRAGERHIVGKVCSICNRVHSNTAKACMFAFFSKPSSAPIPPGLKRYRYLSETDEVIEEGAPFSEEGTLQAK